MKRMLKELLKAAWKCLRSAAGPKLPGTVVFLLPLGSIPREAVTWLSRVWPERTVTSSHLTFCMQQSIKSHTDSLTKTFAYIIQ